MRLSDLADVSASASIPALAPARGLVDSPTATVHEFAVVLGEFRRTAVLVPIDPYGGLWTAEQGGVRWICAFSNEERLARFARAQGDADREWEYRTILGARLLDVLCSRRSRASSRTRRS